MKNAIYTIVAKNYLAMALTLGDSIKKKEKDTDFFIFLIDNEEVNYDVPHNIILVRDLNIEEFQTMSFIYDVVEYSTAIKPYIFEYMFEKLDYDQVIYLDPDIFVFEGLNEIWNNLNHFDFILTPHICDPIIDWNADFNDTDFLAHGIYNLGFLAVNKSKESLKIIKWWKDRLLYNCLAERREALYYDQKWMDFLPSLSDKVLILRNKAYNIAWWNFHEREIKKINNQYFVKNEGSVEEIKFFHFSGYNPLKAEILNKRSGKRLSIEMGLSSFIIEMYLQYGKEVLGNNHEEYIKAVYPFNNFLNGDVLSLAYRRWYRELKYLSKENTLSLFGFTNSLNTQEWNDNLFSVGKDSYYNFLKENRMILENKPIYQNEKNLGGFKGTNKIIKVGIIILKFIKEIFGIKNYLNMLKFFNFIGGLNLQIYILTKKGRK